MKLILKDNDGKIYHWSVFLNKTRPANWALVDHTGYERTLENVWITSIPRLEMIAENHGLRFAHHLS